MRVIGCVSKLLMIIGALNWGLVGFFQYDLVADLFGGMSSGLSRFIYAIIGLAGLYGLWKFFCCCKSTCSTSCSCSCHKKKNQ